MEKNILQSEKYLFFVFGKLRNPYYLFLDQIYMLLNENSKYIGPNRSAV